MFLSLQSLRFVFAVVIFLHHLGVLEAGGSCGVSFFLVLSGFVMAKGYGGKVFASGFSFRHYMEKRLVRLYPLHLVCLLLAMVVHGVLYQADVWGLWLLPNLALLQAWIPSASVYFSGNAVSWCLSDLLFCYAVFPFVWRRMSAVSPFSGYVGWWVCGFLVLYVVALCLVPEMCGNAFFYIFPLSRLWDFLLGMWCFRFYEEAMARGWLSRVRHAVVFEMLGLGLTVLACVLYSRVPANAGYALLFYVPAALTVLAFAFSGTAGSVLSRMLSAPLCCRLGEVSFTFYMVHQLCILAGEACAGSWSVADSLWVRGPLYFVVSLCAAFLLQAVVEKPVARAWRQKRD